MFKNTETSYATITKLLHWVVGVLVIVMLLVGFTMGNIENPMQRGQLYNAHKATGVIVLFLMILRLIWKLINISVRLPADLPQWQKKAATININLLYILMCIMPISGFLMTILAGYDINIYGLFTINSFIQHKAISKIFVNIHVFSAFFLTALIILHILAAIYHHFIRKDDVLRRII